MNSTQHKSSGSANELELKCNLLVDGLRIDNAALEGIGSKYKENVAFLFDYNVKYSGSLTMIPQELKFPLGTIVTLNYNRRSPYLVKKEDGQLILEKDGRFLTTVEWTERPHFYGRKTSHGVEMQRIAQICGDDGFVVVFSNYCSNWEGGDQCRFCNMNASYANHKEDIQRKKSAEQIGEVAAAALEEGIEFHLMLTGGALPDKTELEATIEILEAIKRHTGLKQVPGYATITPPREDLSDIERLHAAGYRAVGYNIEVWNPHMFQAICPGKAKKIGHENWVRALEYAASVFGRGQVYTALVTGLEEKESYFEAAEYLAERGVVAALLPWVPMKGSKLEGHRPPHGEWLVEVIEKVVDIQARWLPMLLTKEYFFYSDVLGCYRCCTPGIWWDEIRKRLGGLERPLKRERMREFFDKEGLDKRTNI